MLRQFLIIASFSLTAYCFGQNLVPNPGFEANTGVPDNPGKWFMANQWSNVNGVIPTIYPYASPDYFRTDGIGSFQLPNTVYATIGAHSGKAIMGLVAYHNSSPYREYISIKLKSPMCSGGKYEVSYYVTNGGNNNGKTGINTLGVYFSVAKPNQVNNEIINATPQLVDGANVYSTGWKKYTYTFTATGNYQHITIGNFKNAAASGAQSYGAGASGMAYYFFDDIVVKPIDDNFSVSMPSTAVIDCGQNNVSLTPNPDGNDSDYNYSWNTGANTKSITVNKAGTYTVTVSPKVASCTSSPVTKSVTVTKKKAFNVNAGPDQTIDCNSTSVQVTASASGGSNYTFTWSDGQTGKTVGLAAGTHTITVTGSGGCTSTDQVTITQTEPIGGSLPLEHISCPGLSDGTATAQPTGGDGNYTYAWSNGQTTSSITGLDAGSYDITVTDGSGCSISVNFIINAPEDFNAAMQVTDANGCDGTPGNIQATITGGTEPYTYVWDDPLSQTTSNANDLEPGTYTLEVTDANGCKSTFTETVNGSTSVLEVEISDSQTSGCDRFGSTVGSAVVSVISGEGPFTYEWDTEPPQFGYTAVGLPSGISQVIVQDAAGCSDTLEVNIEELIEVDTLDIIHPSCAGCSDGELSITALGGIEPYTYRWDDDNEQTTATATGLEAGTYTVRVTDSAGCSNTLSFSIGTTALDEDPIFANVRLFPNPVKQGSVIRVKGIEDVSVEIFDVQGQRVYIGQLKTQDQALEIGESITNGIYTVVFTNDTTRYSTKLIVY